MSDELEFKDKEISQVTTAIKKEEKRQLGSTFKDALSPKPAESTIEPATEPATKPEQTADTTTPPQTPASEQPTKTYDPILKTLQTYERDIADAIRTNDTSVASINAAKQKKQLEDAQKRAAAPDDAAKADTAVERKVRTEKFTRGGLTILVSAVLIVGGLVLFGSIYYFAANRPEPVVSVAPALITVDKSVSADITGLTGADVVQEILRARDNTGAQSISRLQISEGVADAKKEITPARFFDLTLASAPPTLRRAFGNEWLLGFHGQDVGAATFTLITVTSFENAFDGMLRWEPTIVSDTSSMFLSAEKVASTSGRTFEDNIIRNKDVRVLRDASGNAILLYSFLDQKHLLITTNETAFTEILNRFFSSRIVR